MADEQDPDLSTTIRQAMISSLADLHTAVPARVESFASGPPATVKVSVVLDYFHRGEDGAPVQYSPPQLDDVPVVYPGSGDYGITYPLAVGDYVLLIFCERSIADWLRNGGTGIAPAHRRRHSMSDAFAIPGARPKTSDIPASGHDAAATVVRGPTIKLGDNTAAKGVNRDGDDVLAGAALVATLTAINTALTTLSAGAGVPIVTPPAIAPNDVIGETGDGSSVVKAVD